MAGSGDHIYHYNYFDPNLDLFGGISIFEFIPNTFELNQWVFATRGSWEGSHWVLKDGWVRRMDLKGRVDYRRFDRFDAHQLDGPDFQRGGSHGGADDLSKIETIYHGYHGSKTERVRQSAR